MEQNQQNPQQPVLNPDCPCTSHSCRNHGNCEKCQSFHHNKRGDKTSCGK